MANDEIRLEGERAGLAPGAFLIQSVPGPADNGTPGQYVALIRTSAGLYGRFVASLTEDVRGWGPNPEVLLQWKYYVQFDDGRTGNQMCNHTNTTPRNTFAKLLAEIVPRVS